MILSTLRFAVFLFSIASALEAAAPDISNLNNCINDVRQAEHSSPAVLTFDSYTTNYSQLISDLEAASANLPHVYQEAAAKPLIEFIQNLGEVQFTHIFTQEPSDDQSAVLKEIIPDAALAILSYQGSLVQGINAFQEVVSDLYDGFLSDENRVGKQSGKPINPPTYGVIPPLVKFGNADAGPYTWPGDATRQILGMHCGVVSLPPAQLAGGVVAWSCLGHETGGHDVTHADEGLLDELAQKVYEAVYKKFKSKNLANYWARCIDETTADVCGYLNMGPSLGFGLIAYFRALGDGRLRSIGSSDDPHPIDLLRGYLASSVVKHLHFKDAQAWSYAIAKETSKDNAGLYLVDEHGHYERFPVSLTQAIVSTDIVAQTILQSKLSSLQQHSLQELQDWTDHDQAIVDNLALILRSEGTLPVNLRGPGFYASYVVAAATQAAMEHGTVISTVFNEMLSFLSAMHRDNPTWSQNPTSESLALLDRASKNAYRTDGKMTPHIVNPKLPQAEEALVGNL